jgi:CBS domain-containing protein
MLETKIHYLPVVDEKNTMLGLVTARRLLRKALNEGVFNNVQAAEFIEQKNYLQTINISSSFSEAIRFFYNTKLSKLIVVDNNNKLRGIITFFDLLPLLQVSKKRKGFWDRGGEDYTKYENYRLDSYVKRLTTQVSLNTTLNQVIELILEKEIGSVVVMKDKFRPENIITTSDLLKAFVYSVN